MKADLRYRFSGLGFRVHSVFSWGYRVSVVVGVCLKVLAVYSRICKL